MVLREEIKKTRRQTVRRKPPREGGRGGAAPRELEVERWWPWGLG